MASALVLSYAGYASSTAGNKNSEIEKLIENGQMGGGMLPKLSNCVDAVKNGVNRVTIADGRVAHCLLLEMFTNKGIGTMIVGDQL